MQPTPKPSGKVAVISGGSSGIGRAFVEKLHARGYIVITCGRDPAKLEKLAQDFPGVETGICDVSDTAAIRAFADDVVRRHPEIDMLISNAGGMRELDFTRDDITDQDPTEEIRSNLAGAIEWMAAFLPAVRRASPSAIVVVTSGYAMAASTRGPVYSAAKFGLRGFAKALRRQLAGHGVTVTEVLPPLVDTPAVAHRSGTKVSATSVAELALTAVANGKSEVHPGAVRWLPFGLRMAPSFIENVVAKS
ncbi:putative oxidoreductase [Rhodanobacter sp. ANJX3]|uniref:SDR family NAD(P)-dependent oxidoreductase n=1 Tax=Rhodanobacter sp. ANJX3 TaxID=2723083 RepID=UPI00160A0E76|nr:SDR family NAD(P)-dependent oxidoreductase [Rhodanobacter sp. ANJX3]MBB5358518.1 putative oxidoreductase [Rhodanobacter sp. ANJX3]